MYVMQACRGGRFDYGVESEATDGPAEDENQVQELMEQQVCWTYTSRVAVEPTILLLSFIR